MSVERDYEADFDALSDRYKAVRKLNDKKHKTSDDDDFEDDTLGALTYEDTLSLREDVDEVIEGVGEEGPDRSTVDEMEVAVSAFEKEVRELIGNEAVDKVVEDYPMPE
ncbi:hypothetical protein EDF58_11923 [Novosphingobium sp. PhB57]|uniref:hypothetical protein n=1 Tax=Novosphingobium sp. PhB57 TaxID=2485107 RepID=UPI00104AC684|nr:hypothetical protein [Novosphingobium sp. PhB57]TCU51817.1 hypothetical protein EDF58_11923 [Novosphingobium sp. PhB57]